MLEWFNATSYFRNYHTRLQTVNEIFFFSIKPEKVFMRG